VPDSRDGEDSGGVGCHHGRRARRLRNKLPSVATPSASELLGGDQNAAVHAGPRRLDSGQHGCEQRAVEIATEPAYAIAPHRCVISGSPLSPNQAGMPRGEPIRSPCHMALPVGGAPSRTRSHLGAQTHRKRPGRESTDCRIGALEEAPLAYRVDMTRNPYRQFLSASPAVHRPHWCPPDGHHIRKQILGD
jgi:hypothetical protein